MNLTLGLDLSMSGGSTFAPEAATLFSRMTTPPTGARQAIINTLIVALKNTGVWTKLDAFYMFAAADSQAALLNWKGATYNASLVNAPTFTADSNFTGNGTSSYVETSYKFAVGQQDDGHLGLWSLTSAQGAAVDMGNANSLIQCRNTSDLSGHRVNAGSSGTPAQTDGSGHFVSSRVGALNTDNRLYRNAVSGGASAASATPDASNNIRVCGRSGSASFSTRAIMMAHMGSGLTAQNITDLYNAVLAYKTSVGA